MPCKQMVTDLGGSQGSAMRLGASWQVNKNVLLKGRVGLDGIAAAVVFRSWWQPSFTLGAVANLDFRSRQPRYGLYAAAESFQNLRWVWGVWESRSSPVLAFSSLRMLAPCSWCSYERSVEGQKMAGARLTQRHVASPEDLAYHEGKGLLVPLRDVDDPRVLGQVAATIGADCL